MTEVFKPPVLEEPTLPREPFGWVVLTVIFLLLIGLTLAPTQKAESRGIELAEAQPVIKEALIAGSLGGLAQGTLKEGLLDLRDKAAPTHLTDPISAEIYAVCQFELHQPIKDQELAALRKSSNPIERNVAVIYGAKTLSRADATALSHGLQARGLIGSLIEADAFEKAGDNSKRQALGRAATRDFAVIIPLSLLVFFVSLAGWISCFVLKLSGKLPVLGFPISLPTARDADISAVKAAQVLAAYFGLQFVIGLAASQGRFSGSGLSLLVACGLIAAFPFVVGISASGRKFSLAEIGFSSENLGRNFLIGLLGFAMEIPVATVMGTIGAIVFSGAKDPTHPASVTLLNSHNPITVIGLFLAASVVAPLYEEVIFRGLMFPGLAKLMRNIPVSGIITSLIFASLHPQGAAAWLALATVGGMSCLLVVHTKSLVPSVFMHMAHNASILVFVLLTS